MSAMHRKLPEVISLIEEVDTIIIDRKILGDDSKRSSGVYTIKNEIVDDRNIARLTSDDEGLHKGTVSRIVSDVLTSLCNKRDQFIKWPRNVDETRGDFYRLSGFPNVLGAIDGTHVRIQAPSEDEASFVNRKGVHSVNVQAVCDAKDHIHNMKLTINDDNGKMVLMCVNDNRNCLRNALHIYSPAGFILGSVRERHFKWTADYDICTGNQEVIFLITHDHSASYLTIKIKQKYGTDMVATVSSSHGQNGEFIYSIIYLKKITVLQKMLILAAVLTYCHRDRRSKMVPILI